MSCQGRVSRKTSSCWFDTAKYHRQSVAAFFRINSKSLGNELSVWHVLRTIQSVSTLGVLASQWEKPDSDTTLHVTEACLHLSSLVSIDRIRSLCTFVGIGKVKWK